MHRTRIGIWCMIMIFVFGTSLEVAGQNPVNIEQNQDVMVVPMGVVILEPDASVEQKKSPVEFNHSKHFMIAEPVITNGKGMPKLPIVQPQIATICSTRRKILQNIWLIRIRASNIINMPFIKVVLAAIRK